jgi:hypothetical protein
MSEVLMPTVFDLACMAEAVYDNDESQIYAASIPGPVHAKPDHCDGLNCLTVTDRGAFRGAVYATGSVRTIVYRGTPNSEGDWKTEGSQPERPPQFTRAMQFATDAIQDYGLDPETTCLCGHSLGGALAKYVAHGLARQGWVAAAALSFNGPGLSFDLLEKAVVYGLYHIAEGTPMGLGLQAVERLIQEKDIPIDGKTLAKIANVNVRGDKVSQFGDAVGPTYVLTAPEFVLPANAVSIDPPDRREVYRRRVVYALERERYLHSIHTLRRLLADDPLGKDPVKTIVRR